VIITKEQKAVLYMLSASLLFSIVAMCAKLVSRLGPLEITFFRNAVGLVVLLFVFGFTFTRKFNSSKLHLLLFRGFIGTVALIAFFYNVTLVHLADAMTISKTEPLFSALIGFFLLHERLSPPKIAALILGFCGVLAIGIDKGAGFAYANIVGIFGGFCAALAYTTIRRIRDDFDHRFVVLSFMLFGTFLPLLLMLSSVYVGEGEIMRSFTAPVDMEYASLLFIGVLSAFGQILMTKAYFYAKAGIVSTVSYSTVLFGVLLGLFIGEGWPTLFGFLGMGLIIASGFLIAKK